MTFFPVGKLPANVLAGLLHQYRPTDPRVVVSGSIGHDAAVIDMGDRYLVAKTDPITFATSDIGWYAVQVNANDVACTGAAPRWFLATLLLPESNTSAGLVEDIFRQITDACRALGIALVGGHTEITYGLSRPLVAGQMLGEVAKERLVTTAGAQVGDDLILTKGIAIEATAIIAREKAAELQPHFDAASLNAYANFLRNPGISVVKDAAIATAAGQVNAMHDPTEGGVVTALHELAEAAGVGLEIVEKALPVLPETDALCRRFSLDPLGVIASGALLIAAAPTDSRPIVAALTNAGIRAEVIGQVTPAAAGRILQTSAGPRPLPTFARDEITRLFE